MQKPTLFYNSSWRWKLGEGKERPSTTNSFTMFESRKEVECCSLSKELSLSGEISTQATNQAFGAVFLQETEFTVLVVHGVDGARSVTNTRTSSHQWDGDMDAGARVL